ncbi:MAG: hypothetical protein AAF570_24010, partial [Bacteroidota bacterium]
MLARLSRRRQNLTLVGGGGFYQKKWKNTSVAVSGNYTDVTPLFLINKQRADWEIPPRSEEGSVIFRHKPNKGGIIKLYTSMNHQRFVVKDFFPLDTLGNISITRTRLNSLNLYNNASYRQLLNDKWVLFTGASYSFDKDNIDVNGLDILGEDHRMQGKAWVSRAVGKNSKVWAGGEAHYLQNKQGFGTLTRELSDVYSAGFVESEIYLSPKIAARPGVRVENSTLIGRTNVAPRLSFALKTGKSSSISVAAGQFYQTPSNEFTYFDQNLDFELASHLIANYTWIKNRRTFRVEGYYKNYDNLVAFDTLQLIYPDLGLGQSAYNNTGEGYAYGVDFFWRDPATIKNGDYWISYSYLDTKRRYRDYPVEAVPYFASTHNASFVFKYFIAEIRCALGASYNYGSGRTFRAPFDFRDGDNFLNETTPAFHLVSANVSYLTTIRNNFT